MGAQLERRLGWIVGGAVAVAWVVFEWIGNPSAGVASEASPIARDCGCEDPFVDSKLDRRGSASRERDRDDDVELEDEIAKLETHNALLAERAVTGELGYYNLGQAELEAMARHCDVRSDYPKMLEPQELDDLGMSASEREAWTRALERFAADELERYRGLLAEIDPSTAELDTLSLGDVRRQLTKVAGRAKTDADSELKREVAEERAGLRDAPEDLAELSAWNRYNRLQFDAGDRFAAALSDELGSDCVHELRSAFDGWPGARTRQVGCDDSPKQPD